MNFINIWTDGSVNLKNNNKCAWAFVCYLNGEIVYKDRDILYESHRTGNIAEMVAIINSLKWLNKTIKDLKFNPSTFNVDIYSDSQYCVKGINEWINKWILKNFQGVKNRKYWEELHSIVKNNQYNRLTFNWVRGHSGITENEMVDQMCYELTRSK